MYFKYTDYQLLNKITILITFIFIEAQPYIGFELALFIVILPTETIRLIYS